MHRSISHAGLARRALAAILLTLVTAAAASAEPITLWPNISFVRGQDACQHLDAFGVSKRQQAGTMIAQIESLLMAGSDIDGATQALKTIDALIEKDRRAARRSTGIDTTLEGAFKAALDEIYRRTQPAVRMIGFANPTPLEAALAAARDPGRTSQTIKLQGVNGFVWGSYSFAPGCSANLFVTLHIQESCGRIVSFQGVGRAERVMSDIAAEVFRSYQATRFPTTLEVDGRIVRLTSPAGAWISRAATPEQAEMACKASGARLPTPREYELLEIRGDWNGGICTQGRYWALANDQVLAPELTRPSPIRNHNEVTSSEFYFYCVSTPPSVLSPKAGRE